MKNFLPKLLITDIDGVWTDGGMYYDNHGNEWKKFNTSDSAGVLFLRLLDIPLAIMTGENSIAVKNRAEKLKIKTCYLGVKNKLSTAQNLCMEMGIKLSDVAFIGDDINDLRLLRAVGFSATPAHAPKYIQSEVDLVLKKKGGEGVFREFVEYLLEKEGLLQKALQGYLESIKK